MPQLTSGRHAGLSFVPLETLIREACEGRAVHQLMAIESLDHLDAYAEAVELTPVSTGGRAVLADGSSPTSLQFDDTDTGVHFDALDPLIDRGWTPAEVDEFRQFWQSSSRAQDMKVVALSRAREAQLWLLEHGPFVARLAALWWRAECHPAQEEKWDDSDPSTWDDYDLLVAIRRLAAVLAPSIEQINDYAARDAILRAQACADLPGRHIANWDDAISAVTGLTTLAAASKLRDQRILEVLPADDRQWFRSQFADIATAMADNIDGAVLRNADREATLIATLVSVGIPSRNADDATNELSSAGPLNA